MVLPSRWWRWSPPIHPRDAGRRPMEAYLLIETDRETGPIAGFVRGVPGVLLAQDVRGPYDALALARSDPGGRGLERTLAEIRGMPGVIRALAAPLIPAPAEVAEGRAA